MVFLQYPPLSPPPPPLQAHFIAVYNHTKPTTLDETSVFWHATHDSRPGSWPLKFAVWAVMHKPTFGVPTVRGHSQYSPGGGGEESLPTAQPIVAQHDRPKLFPPAMPNTGEASFWLYTVTPSSQTAIQFHSPVFMKATKSPRCVTCQTVNPYLD